MANTDWAAQSALRSALVELLGQANADTLLERLSSVEAGVKSAAVEAGRVNVALTRESTAAATEALRKIDHQCRTLDGKIDHQARMLDSKIDHQARMADSKIDHQRRMLDSKIDHQARMAESKIDSLERIRSSRDRSVWLWARTMLVCAGVVLVVFYLVVLGLVHDVKVLKGM